MTILSSGFNLYATERNRIMVNAALAEVRDTANEGGLYYVQARFQAVF